MIPATLCHNGFDPSILREYDIRGQIEKNLSGEDAYLLGRAFSAFLNTELENSKPKTICVGRDGRLSSPDLYENLCDGLIASGLHVIRVGIGSSPMLYFSVQHLRADAGIMVTGSHNPPDYNGFKMTLRTRPIFGDKIQEIGQIAQHSSFVNGQGSSEEIDISEIYIDRLLKDLTLNRDLRIAWDAGNGAAGELMQRLTKKMRGKHFLLYEKIDGTFPNHHPDPTVDENLADLQSLVLREKCDLGFAFDGDGDRIGVVDEYGKVIRCDTLLALYAREILQTHPNATIIGDIKCSQILYDEIKRLGGNPVMWKTGHSLIKDKMREMNAPLAGELSGHIFFADKYYGFDDALYCAIRLLNELSDEDSSLSALTASLPQTFNTPEIRFEVKESEKFTLVHKLAESIQKEFSNTNIDICTLDGIRVTTPDGWWLLRASNTQNVLVARMESLSQSGLERIKHMATSQILKIGYTLSGF